MLIDQLKLKFPDVDIPKRLEEWKSLHPGENVEEMITKVLKGEYTPPIFILRSTYICNNKCIHCFIEDEKKLIEEPKFDDLKKAIDETLVNEELVIVSGGEPTTRKDLLELMKYIHDKGKEVNIQSNGMNFDDEKYLASLAPYFTSINLPIHSNNPDIFDSITRVKGSYERTVKAFHNLVDVKINVISQTVINQLNYKTLTETFDLIQSISPGAKMTLTFPHPISSAHSNTVVPKFSEIKSYVQKVLKKYAYLINTHYIPKCLLYPYHGLVYYVDSTDDGETRKPGIVYADNTWQKIDYGNLMPGSRIKSNECKKCRFDNECLGVWKEYGEIYNNELDMAPII